MQDKSFVKNLFLVIKTAIINTQILTCSIKSYSRDLSLCFIDAFFIEILPFTDFSKPDQRTSLWQNIKPSTHDWTNHWTTSYHKATWKQVHLRNWKVIDQGCTK